MEASELFQPGMVREMEVLVEERHLAAHIGSGSYRVLATPIMIGFMEMNSHRLLAEGLPEGFSSVGVRVEVSHLAPTPLGMKVRVRSQVLAVEDQRITFQVEAWDDQEQIGTGRHERVVIDESRFLRRVARKSGQEV